jgi:NAD(P)H dehydrogenase (quinone)
MFSVANGKTYQKAIDSLPSDVKHELAKLLAADYVISISPIWWGSSPAMLTGYFDKVFVAGATWGFGEGKPIGMLKGKKALNIFLAGAPEVAYKQVHDHIESRVLLKDRISRIGFNI